MTAVALSANGPADRSSSMSQASRKSMRKSGEALRSFGVIEPQFFAERVATFLRMMHPQKTADSVAADTGIPTKTVAKWLQGAAGPTGRYYHQLLGAYGFELYVYVNPDASSAEMREAARIQHQHRLERQNEDLRRRLAGQLSEIWGTR